MKRILAYIGVVVLSTFLVLSMLLMVVRSSRVQTAAAGVLTEQLSRALGATVSVKTLDYQFPNRLLIKQFRVEDQEAHPLLSIDTLSAKADLIKLLFSDTLCIKQVALRGGYADVHRHADSTLNYQFLIDAFKKEKKEPQPLPFTLQIETIELTELYLNYLEWSGYLPEAKMHLRDLSNGHLDAEIEQLAFAAEHQGQELDIRNIEAHLIINDSIICFPKMRIQMPRSDFRIDQFYIAKEAGKVDKARLNNVVSLQISAARITPADMAALEPKLRGMRQPWDFTASVSGSIDSLQVRNLSLSYANKKLLKGNLTALGLPSLDSLWVRAQVEDLSVNKATLQDILSGVAAKPVNLPNMLTRLGQVHYRGALEGRLENLTLRGALTSALGSIRTDGRAYAAADFSEFDFKGSLSTRRFDLGKLLNVPDMGTIAMTINGNGISGADIPFFGRVDANIEHFQYRGYTYQDLRIDGRMRNKVFDGKVTSSDPNILFSFAGKVDLNNHQTPSEFTLRLAHFRPGELHLSDKYADSDLGLTLSLNMRGAQLDDISGILSLDSLRFNHAGEHFFMRHLELMASEEELHTTIAKRHSLHIESDIINARFWGIFSYKELPTSVLRIIAQALPNAISEQKERELRRAKVNSDLEFYVYLKDLDRICRVLELPVTVTGVSTIKGSLSDLTTTTVARSASFYTDDSHHLGSQSCILQAHVPLIEMRGQRINDMVLSFDNNADDRHALSLQVLAKHTNSNTPAGRLVGALQCRIAAQASADSLTLSLGWKNDDNEDIQHHDGKLRLTTTLSRYSGQPLITTRIHPTTFMFADSLWTLGDARVVYSVADTVIQVEQFSLSSADQSIYANGIVSSSEHDSIYAELKNINLDYLLGALTDVHKAIYFGGNVTGWAKAYGLMRSPMFEADVQMKDGSINGSLLGDVFARARLDKENKRVLVEGRAIDHRLREDKPVAVVDGVIGPKGRWILDIAADSVELGLVEFWVHSFLTDLKGRASGNIHISGGHHIDPNDPYQKHPFTSVTLRCKGHDASFTLPFTGARYSFSDSVFMDSCAILFPPMTIRDSEGHPVRFEGSVRHNGNFKNIKLDLTARPEKAIVLDLPETPDADFFGHVYATGIATVKGTDEDIRIQADATTTGNSSFTLSLSNASNASTSSFISFVDHNPIRQTEKQAAKRPEPESAILLDLKMGVTPEATVSVLLDRQTGDCLRGRGEGDIRFTYSEPGSKMQMLGSFVLQSGTFGFTFQNVIRKDFQIAEGSSVNWTGVPEEPLVDVRALYSTTASLQDLFGSEVSSITNRTNVPVQCVLNLSDHLSNPILNFGIELPSSDETVASAVRSVINTDEMLMRQVLYLLIFNRFYTPEYLRSEGNTGINETYSLISSTVTGQINSWLSKLTDKFTLGFNVRTDANTANASQEYEAQFEITPVKGLIINGNFGYRYNDISNQPIFGNLDIEYMLTPNGKLRLKGYTHTVDKYSMRQANTIQGVGFVFKHDYNIPDSAQRAQKKAMREAQKAEKAQKAAAAKEAKKAAKGK